MFSHHQRSHRRGITGQKQTRNFYFCAKTQEPLIGWTGEGRGATDGMQCVMTTTDCVQIECNPFVIILENEKMRSRGHGREEFVRLRQLCGATWTTETATVYARCIGTLLDSCVRDVRAYTMISCHAHCEWRRKVDIWFMLFHISISPSRRRDILVIHPFHSTRRRHHQHRISITIDPPIDCAPLCVVVYHFQWLFYSIYFGII